MPKYSKEIAIHLSKARESALLAVETYNRPQASFRSGGFIVMMCIAWTALFHAVFFKRKKKPFYRRKTNKRHFEILDGDKKAWELSTCIDEYWLRDNTPERANLDLFVRLRNKIEHRSMPALDMTIFGECQALLFNFEDLLVKEFGGGWALNESLSLALQFSCMRSDQQDKSIRKLQGPLAKDLRLYLDSFRSSLSTDILQDSRFSYKVFLVPKPANHQQSADLSVEFVKFDQSKPEEMERYDKIVSLIKPGPAPSINPALSIEAGANQNISIRLVNDPNAPTFRPLNYDDDFPDRQKEVTEAVNAAFPERKKIMSHEVAAVRSVHNINADPRYCYRPKFGSPQYSKLFISWLIEAYKNDEQFFAKAREEYKQKSGGG